MKALRCIAIPYPFTTSLNFCQGVARNLHENCYILIRFEVFSFWYIALLPRVYRNHFNPNSADYLFYDYMLQRIEDSQILVTKGSIVELRAADIRSCANNQVEA